MAHVASELVSRLSIRKVHRLIVGGLIAFWLMLGALIDFRVSPLAPEDPVHPAIAATVCAGFLLAGLFWARPRIPVRLSTVTIEDYRREARPAMDRFIFLLEGSSTLAAVWTMLTASWLTAVVGLVSVAVMAFNGPERFEETRPES